MMEAIFGGDEPSGVSAFGHHCNLNTNTTSAVSTPATGARVINTSGNMSIRAASYITSFADQAIQTLTAGATRAYTCGVQVTIADSRRHDVHIRPGATDFGDPQTGQRVRVQATSTAMTAPGADVTTSASWFATSISGRAKCWLYHDGSATSGSHVRLIKLRLLRKIDGSL